MNVAPLIESLRPFFERWSEVEHAERWACPECQFESNKHYTSHESTCSQRKRVAS